MGDELSDNVWTRLYQLTRGTAVAKDHNVQDDDIIDHLPPMIKYTLSRMATGHLRSALIKNTVHMLRSGLADTPQVTMSAVRNYTRSELLSTILQTCLHSDDASYMFAISLEHSAGTW
jgi:hypothetical protein